MLKKRVIFTLLYDSGSFVLSRNFTLQKVGDESWLRKNYNFKRVAHFIDELIILDVSRQNRNIDLFCDAIRSVAEYCFVPISAGGGIKNISNAKSLLQAGADKIVVNSALFHDQSFVTELVREYGSQCIVASFDINRTLGDNFEMYTRNGSCLQRGSSSELISQIVNLGVGEFYVNSINQDGTGQGFDLEMVRHLFGKSPVPVIIAGGAGHSKHLVEGLREAFVDAVATANLFNFVGDGLKRARSEIINSGIEIAHWEHISDLNLNTI